jgi:GDP-L-fucose synthase
MKNKKKVFIAGHNGMVGSAILKLLKKKKIKTLTINKKNLNLLDQKKVFNFLKKKKPSHVIIAAARVGGINANSKYKSKFLYENSQIQNNLIHGALIAGVKNLIFLGSSCVYPKNFRKPIKESDILKGEFEKTNDAYAIAKIAGIKLCEYYSKEFKVNYKTLMPTNLYGPKDNYNLSNSHFIPALIKKIYLAKINNSKSITIWGTGKPLREVMYVDDLANAILFFLNKKIKESFINIGSGFERTIKDFVDLICCDFKIKLKIKFDTSKPNGMMRKRLNLDLAKSYGWSSKISFKSGLKKTIKDFIKNENYH